MKTLVTRRWTRIVVLGAVFAAAVTAYALHARTASAQSRTEKSFPGYVCVGTGGAGCLDCGPDDNGFTCGVNLEGLGVVGGCTQMGPATCTRTTQYCGGFQTFCDDGTTFPTEGGPCNESPNYCED